MSAKKPFVKPEISQPVDVLEATTFFQVLESGGTGAKSKKGGSGNSGTSDDPKKKGGN